MFATTVKTLVLSTFLAGLVFVGAASADTFKSDPRICTTPAGVKISQQGCALQAAIVTIKHRFARMPGNPDPQPVCTTKSPKFLVWRCEITDDQGGQWVGTVTLNRNRNNTWASVLRLHRI